MMWYKISKRKTKREAMREEMDKGRAGAEMTL